MVKYGIDVSRHNGTIDWNKVKNSGKVDFVILRAGYGKLLSQKDSRFEEYYKACEKMSIPVGIYWYSYALSEQEAVQEAKVCLSCIKGKKISYPVYFDIEEKSQFRLGKLLCSKMADAFCSTIKKEGYQSGIYASKSNLETYLNLEVRQKYTIWVAHYGVSKTTYNGKYDMWQKSEKGKINGITGNVDLDECYVNFLPNEKSKEKNEQEKVPDLFYQVFINSRWLPAVKNLNDYAGIKNHAISGISIGSNFLVLKYRAKLLNGKWLPWVSKNDINDENGYAGIKNKSIDCIQIKIDGSSEYEIKYRVSIKGSSEYLPWVLGDSDYAGITGKEIDKFQAFLIKKE